MSVRLAAENIDKDKKGWWGKLQGNAPFHLDEIMALPNALAIAILERLLVILRSERRPVLMRPSMRALRIASETGRAVEGYQHALLKGGGDIDDDEKSGIISPLRSLQKEVSGAIEDLESTRNANGSEESKRQT